MVERSDDKSLVVYYFRDVIYGWEIGWSKPCGILLLGCDPGLGSGVESLLVYYFRDVIHGWEEG